MEAVQIAGMISLGSAAFIALIYGELKLLQMTTK